MLGFAEAGQVGVDGSDERTFMAEVDLDLAQVLTFLEQVRGVGMAQRMDVSFFSDAAGDESQTEGALEGGAAHGFGGDAGTQAIVTLCGEQEGGMAMAFPLVAQKQHRAFGQGDVTILIAFAAADMQEHALRIDVADLEIQAFTQAQAAGVDGDQADPMIQGGDLGEDAAGFGGREDDGEFGLVIGASQLEFVGPDAMEGFSPEKFDGADHLGAGLAGDLLIGLEMDAIPVSYTHLTLPTKRIV